MQKSLKNAVLISCFNWYESRLKPIKELLIERGYNVSVLIADFDHIKKNRISNRYIECTYINVPKYRRNLSFKRIRSHWMFCKKCKGIIEKQKPDLIYCMVPPNKIADYCADYKKRNSNTKLIIDIIDLWPESLPLGKLKEILSVTGWKRWRDDALYIADYTFTECDFYHNELNQVINPSKITTLYLYKEQYEKEKKLVREIIGTKKTDEIIRFAYLGSMNHIIDIDGICRVIQLFIDSGKTCELHAIGDGEGRKNFENAVNDTGCRTYFYGIIFNEIEKIKILAPCDYAFNMMKKDVRVGLTIKSIDYLSYGLPLINNISGDTWKLINDYNLGINVDGNLLISVFDEFSHVEIHKCYQKMFMKEAFMNRINKAFGEVANV